METVKKTAEYTIVKKRSGRYGILAANRKWIHGEEKVKLLLGAKLIKLTASKKPKEAAAPAPAAETAVAETPKAE